MSDKKKKEQNITSLSRENRLFKPDKSFSSSAYIKSFQQYKKAYDRSIKDPEKFWGKLRKNFTGLRSGQKF